MADDDIKVLVLRGAEGVFSTGADMNNAYNWYGPGDSKRRPSQRRRLGARFALRYGPRRVVSSGLFLMSVGLVVASRLDAASAYFGPVILAMALMAIGLSLVTAPATEAVMSSLPKEDRKSVV